MATPIITLLGSDQATAVSEWHVGTVKAGNDSAVLEVNVWNNKGGSAAVSDLIESTVAVKDGNGDDTGAVPAGLWVQTLIDTTADVDANSTKQYSKIGGQTTRPLRGNGILASAGDVISGAINDGTAANSGNNYCNCKFKVNVPQNSVSGTQQFKIRFQGYYV